VSPLDAVVAIDGDAVAADGELLTTELPVPLALQAATAPARITLAVKRFMG
jgi:hypothetical protein